MGKLPLRKALPHVIALLSFLILSSVYFFPQIQGKNVIQSDILSNQAMSHEAREYRQETGKLPLWTNSMFSGMPTYQIVTGAGGNLMRVVEKAYHLFISRPIGYFVGAMIGFYILLIILGVNPWLSIIGAVAFALSTNNVVLFEAGHTSKLRALFTAAPVIAGVVLTFRGRRLAGGALFALALAVNLYVNHYQITYYLLLLLGIYGLIELVIAVRAGELKAFLRSAAILVAGAALAVGTSASKILTTMEYARDTMRGQPILEENKASPISSSVTEGLAWDYAMQWSNGAVDVLAGIVPRAAGGSGAEKTGDESELYKAFTRRGVRLPTDFDEPLYWGALPFTSGPAYFGAILVFLFLLGAVVSRGALKWWLVSAVILTILMSMGKHFEWFNRLLFDYLLYYNKFRAPSSILSVTAVLIPALAFLGLKPYFNGDKDKSALLRPLYISAGISAAVCLFLMIAGPAMFDFTGASDVRYDNAGYDMDAIIADRKKYLIADCWRSLLFIVGAAATIWFYIKGNLSKYLAIAIIGILVITDLWGVDKRYLDENDFTATSYQQSFVAQEVDNQILQDEDIHYRVHDVTTDAFQNALRSYFHKTIGGYHPAKLQRYQDIIDYYLRDGFQPVLNMLNAKYFIVPGQNGNPRVQRNPGALGNAWFVEDIRIVESADEEIESLRLLDPAADAIVHKEYAHLVEGFDPVKNGSIELIEYAPDRLLYESSSRSDQLAVFSEVWYGPDKGWKAYIDGQPAELLRVNYILRALNVPAGEHTIEMVFRPDSYYTGKAVSLISSLILIIAFLAVVVIEARNRWHAEPLASQPKKTSTTSGTKSSPTRKKKKRKKRGK